MYHQHKKNINLFNFVSFLFLLFNQWILQNHYFLFRVQKAAPLKVVLWFQGQAAIPTKWANQARAIISTRYFIFKIIQPFLTYLSLLENSSYNPGCFPNVLNLRSKALYSSGKTKQNIYVRAPLKKLNSTTSPFNAYVIYFIFPVHKTTGFILEFQKIKQYILNHRKTALSGNIMN